ncbi:MAG: hypothetical protein O2895_00300, partial [Chloroflexi bacterium]|nr:hypothetical protein [Chloroflexota bacterium]
EAELGSMRGPPTFSADGLVVPLVDAVALLDPASGELLPGRPLEALGAQVPRWVVVLEQGLFIVDGPGIVLSLQ